MSKQKGVSMITLPRTKAHGLQAKTFPADLELKQRGMEAAHLFCRSVIAVCKTSRQHIDESKSSDQRKVQLFFTKSHCLNCLFFSEISHLVGVCFPNL